MLAACKRVLWIHRTPRLLPPLCLGDPVRRTTPLPHATHEGGVRTPGVRLFNNGYSVMTREHKRHSRLNACFAAKHAHTSSRAIPSSSPPTHKSAVRSSSSSHAFTRESKFDENHAIIESRYDVHVHRRSLHLRKRLKRRRISSTSRRQEELLFSSPAPLKQSEQPHRQPQQP